MNKNIARIIAGLRSVGERTSCAIMSGTVVAGSYNDAEKTISVQPADDGMPIEHVKLNGISGNNNGFVLVPKDDSNVVIASVDGPGEWMVVKTSYLNTASIILESVSCTLTPDTLILKNGDTVLDLSNTLFKMNTSSETLYALLSDLVTYITQLTVPTPSGTSAPPVNIADFNALSTRIGNLLTS